MLKLLEFSAAWCPPCQMMKPIFAELEKEFVGRVGFEIVDVDKNSEKATKYGVLSVPTFVLEKDGREAERLVGAHPKGEMIALFHRYLQKPS